MPELDPFETRLEHAVHAFADNAQANVDAAQVARRVASERPRTGARALLGHEVPVPATLLVLLVLLLLTLIATVSVGGRGDSTLPAPTANAVVVPVRTATPITDGEGDEVIRGTEAMVGSTDPGQATVSLATNDVRTTGTGTWRPSSDVSASVAAQSGTYRLANAQGSWDGTCSGGAWDAGAAASRSCWLTGSGAYDGFSFFFIVTQTALGSGAIEGVVYPGPPVGP